MSTLSFNVLEPASCFTAVSVGKDIPSPLNQFEIKDLLALDILSNLHISITNIGLYLIIGALFLLLLNLLSANFYKIVGNS